MRRLTLASGFFLLAGCALNVEPFLMQDIEGDRFTDYLAREYQQRTAVEVHVDQEWNHASRLAERGSAAQAGHAVEPWHARNWNVKSGDIAELESARERLVAALNSGGREQNPEACAKAQVYYDGWLEQAHDNDLGKGFRGPVQPDYVAAEKAAYYDMIPYCEPEAVPQVKQFTIYFGWNSSKLTGAANDLIAEISNYAAGLEGGNVSLEGHADRSGPDAYNMTLSRNRAAAVAGALSARNITDVSISAAGETRPAVPTADNVREPLNRRVEVEVSGN